MARVLMIAYTTYICDGRVKRHAQSLADRGDHIDVICLANPHQGERNGVNVIGLKQKHYRGSSRMNYVGSYLNFFARASWAAFRLSLKRRYDVVIVCTMPDAAVICALPARLFGSKVVLDVHDTMPELYRDKFPGRRGRIGERLLKFEERASTWFAHRVLAVHELHRLRLESAGVAPGKIHVVVNTPDSRIFVAHRNGAAPKREFTIVCHGTVARRLGLDVAIYSMIALRERVPEARLLLIGAGDYLDEAKATVARRGLGDVVRFEPPVPLERLPEVLSRADIGLVPNYSNSATNLMLPVKLLEYATLGIPAVAARLNTVEYYFDDNSVEFFKAGDPADLARAIERLHLDPERRSLLTANAARIIDGISFEKERMNYYRAIDSLLAAAPATSAEHLSRQPAERSQ